MLFSLQDFHAFQKGKIVDMCAGNGAVGLLPAQ